MISMGRQVQTIPGANFSILASKVKRDRPGCADQYLVVVVLVPAVFIARPIRPHLRRQPLGVKNGSCFVVGHVGKRDYASPRPLRSEAMKVFDAGLEAHGFIALGQFATGVFAFGQIATGVVAVGQLARGVITIGQISLGVFAIGQLAVGLAYSAGMVSVGSITGGLITVPALARWRLRDALGDRDEFEIVPRHPRRILLLIALALLVAFVALAPIRDLLNNGETVPRR